MPGGAYKSNPMGDGKRGRNGVRSDGVSRGESE
jgi:hypothetical protein